MLRTLLSALIMVLTSLNGTAFASDDITLEKLGEKLFFDTSLSEPNGQSCASCHTSTAGFADPDRELPVSRGIHPNRFGDRNAPSVAYAMFSPAFHFDREEKLYVGGQFWDGRAATLEEQAKGPFLNPVEMANPDINSVIGKIRAAPYASDFDVLFGKNSLDEATRAYEYVASAIAAFERSEHFRPFSSKYDLYLAGKVELSTQEKRGLELFKAEDKGNCAACHPADIQEDGTPPLFTDFTYDNLGVPRNRHSPFYTQDTDFNPAGQDYVDIGLAKTTGRDEDKGKFKVPTLRNIELTAPYMHNGAMQVLREVVDFYNTRDTRGDWGSPEVAENVNTEELGNLELTDEEVEDIVAFMLTLADGYKQN